MMYFRQVGHFIIPSQEPFYSNLFNTRTAIFSRGYKVLLQRGRGRMNDCSGSGRHVNKCSIFQSGSGEEKTQGVDRWVRGQCTFTDRNFSMTPGRSLRGFCPRVDHCLSVGRAFTVRCGILLLRRLVYHLALALIQIKRAVHFLLLQTQLTQPFFMLKGAVKLLPVISERLFVALRFGLFFFGKSVKAAEGMFNAGYRAECVLGVQVRFVGMCTTQIQPRCSITAQAAHKRKAFVVAEMLYFPTVFP